MEVPAQKVLTAIHHDNRVEKPDIKFPTVPAKRDNSLTMKALEFEGNMNVKVKEVPRVQLTDPTDAVIRVTGSTICGSDLHLYHHELQTMSHGDIMGHEAIGIIDAVGPEVRNFRVGDRVAISAVISCGQCEYCQRKQFSCCDRTNSDPTGSMEKLYGHRLGGLFGYSQMLGGFEGCQAEFVRVPIADVNLLKLSPGISDEHGVLLTDIACTAWHANELAEVREGDTVCIWGCGPVGQLCCYWAKFRGAKYVVCIDYEPYRLAMAKEKAGADEIINRTDTDVVKRIQELIPGGPDRCIDASGFRFARSLAHRAMRATGLETDSPETVNELITVCRKAGNISLIADYFGYTNHFNLGAMMEKSVTVRGGQLFCQKYWQEIMHLMETGRVDLTWVYTHRLPMSKADEGYRMFDKKEDNVMKILLVADRA